MCTHYVLLPGSENRIYIIITVIIASTIQTVILHTVSIMKINHLRFVFYQCSQIFIRYSTLSPIFVEIYLKMTNLNL